MSESDRGPYACRHLKLIHEAARRIGSVLDVGQTARDLAEILTPDMAECVVVDLHEGVALGEEPPAVITRPASHAVRAAVAGRAPRDLIGPGSHLPTAMLPAGLDTDALFRGEPMFIGRRDIEQGLRAVGPEGGFVAPAAAHSAVAVPLYARGGVLGAVVLWNFGFREYSPTDITMLKEVASRAALAIDNARRYTREYNTVLALQRQLLAGATAQVSAVRTAAGYRAADSAGGLGGGGDWFDVIVLSSARVALVIGDVFGRGLTATAAMGRLRTAVRTLAELDLDPDELLTHLDALVQRLVDEAQPEAAPLGATCLYMVYDPIDGVCRLASAGHPAPLVVAPRGDARFLDIVPGPPLGVGGLPFPVTATPLPEGSVIALYTDGLVTNADRDVDAARLRLGEAAVAQQRTAQDLSAACDAVMEAMDVGPARDDAALLLARTGILPPPAHVRWEFPAQAEAVADTRRVVRGALEEWGLDDLVFTTELVVTELVTNAFRHASGPIGLRLIRDRTLVCEVSDPSDTQPRMRRALSTDEGGRGLLLVAQLTDRWGCRHGTHGKTIWAEQQLPLSLRG